MDGDANWVRSFGRDGLHVLCKDPMTLWAYWEFQEDVRALTAGHFGASWASLSLAVRVSDCTDILFDGQNGHSERFVTVAPDQDNVYLRDLSPGRVWAVDLGVRLLSGGFFTLLRGQSIATPRRAGDPHAELRFAPLGVSSRTLRASLGGYPMTSSRPYEETFDGYSVIEGGVRI